MMPNLRRLRLRGVPPSRYDGGMPVTKRAISLDPKLDEEIRAAARDSGESVSHWLAEAAAERLRQKYLGEAVDWFEREEGAFTPEEIEEVRKQWRG
jgi:uracil-DNA glycosylase